MEHREAGLRMTEPCDGPEQDQARFLRELRQLRAGAGLGQAELAARAHYPCAAIRAAEAGPALPDLPVLSAYVRGCGGTVADWEERWRTVTSSPAVPLLPVRAAGCSDAATAGARVGSVSVAADGHDPVVVMAALSRVADGIASEPPPPGWPSRGAASPAAASPGSASPVAASRGSASPAAAPSVAQSAPRRRASESSATAPTAATAADEPEPTVLSRSTNPQGPSSLRPWITTAVILLCMVAALVAIFT